MEKKVHTCTYKVGYELGSLGCFCLFLTNNANEILLTDLTYWGDVHNRYNHCETLITVFCSSCLDSILMWVSFWKTTLQFLNVISKRVFQMLMWLRRFAHLYIFIAVYFSHFFFFKGWIRPRDTIHQLDKHPDVGKPKYLDMFEGRLVSPW